MADAYACLMNIFGNWRIVGGNFQTSHSSETRGPIFMKLEIYNYFHFHFRGQDPACKISGAMLMWVV